MLFFKATTRLTQVKLITNRDGYLMLKALSMPIQQWIDLFWKSTKPHWRQPYFGYRCLRRRAIAFEFTTSADAALVSNACSEYVHVRNTAALDNRHNSYSSAHTFEKGQLQCSNSKYCKKKKGTQFRLDCSHPKLPSKRWQKHCLLRFVHSNHVNQRKKKYKLLKQSSTC